MKRLSFTLMCLALGGMLLGACSGAGAAPAESPTPLPTLTQSAAIIVEGRIVPQEEVVLAFTVGGRVDEVLASEGDVVQKGTVLARLGDRERLEAAIAAAEAELVAAEQARRRLDEDLALAQAQAAAAMSAANRAVKDAQYALDNFSVPQNMRGLTPLEAVNRMKAALDEARQRFEPYRYYPSEDETRKKLKEELDTAQSDYNTAVRWLQLETNFQEAQTRLEEALKDYQNLLQGPDADALAAAEARLKAAQANLKAAQASLRNLDLVATIDGTVVSLDLVEGQQVAPAQPLVRLADLSQLYVETQDLTEIEVVDVRVGQRVRVVADALPDIKMEGVVESVSEYYIEKRGDITYTVRIRLLNPDPRLRWGMTVVVTFVP